MLNILGKSFYSITHNRVAQPSQVIHGYVQSAATVAGNTLALKDVLFDIANLHYVDGPPMNGSSSRPWWILDSSLEHDMRATDRWNNVVSFPFDNRGVLTPIELT